MALYGVTSRKQTPQSEPIPGSNQVKNSAGGFSFALDDWGRLRRFLILGSEGGTYYASEKDLLKGNHDAITRCLKADGRKTIEMIVEVSDKGLAYRNEAALYALALATASDDQETRKLALEALTKVARIGTHLFHWAHYVNSMRGWSRGLRRAVEQWYTSKSPDQLALQAVKYQQRDGWSHADLLRLAHPRTDLPERDAVFRWMVGGKDALGERKISRFMRPKKLAGATIFYKDQVAHYPERLTSLPALIQAFEEAKTADEKTVIKLITERGLPREAIPTQHLNSAAVWDALLANMPATAMIRNLGKMTSVGLIKSLSKASRLIVDKLTDTEWLKKSRVHPMQFLIAARVYDHGHGEKGSLSWSPDQSIVLGLEQAFYASFGNVTPVGKPMLFSLDISGSMGTRMMNTCLTCAEAETALALVHLGIEDQVAVMGFDTNYRELKLRKGMSLVDALGRVRGGSFGGTDCSLPFTWAARNNISVDAFVLTTDNETWAGSVHPAQALKDYRKSSGNAARSVVIGMTATKFSVADPNDGGSLDAVGFDASTPSLVADFCRGDI